MSGWPAVAVMTALMMVVVIGLNVRLYRRMKAATAAQTTQGDAANG